MSEDLSTLGGRDDTGQVYCNICGWQTGSYNEHHSQKLLTEHLSKIHYLFQFHIDKPDGTRRDVDD